MIRGQSAFMRLYSNFSFRIALIMLRYVPSIPAFWRVLIINGCWILSKVFSASIEIIIWFLFFNLLMSCITLISFKDLGKGLYPWFLYSVTPPPLGLQALCLSDRIPWIYLSLPLYNHKCFYFACVKYANSLFHAGKSSPRLFSKKYREPFLLFGKYMKYSCTYLTF